MNYKRGLFRLWLLLSAMYIIAVFVFSYKEISTEFKNASLSRSFENVGILLVPALVSDGLRGENQCSKEHPMSNVCWYQMPTFRSLYPEYKDISDREIANRLYLKIGRKIQNPDPWQLLAKISGVAVAIPLLVLALGGALVWVVGGFRIKS